MENYPPPVFDYQALEGAYKAEVSIFTEIAKLPQFKELLFRFIDYKKYLQARPSASDVYSMIERVSHGTRILDAEMDDPFIRDVFYTSHVAACCELFKESGMTDRKLSSDNFLPDLEDLIPEFRDAPKETLNTMHVRLHMMDAIRTMQILRNLGLVSIETSAIDQLGIGAGTGKKDIMCMHSDVSIVNYRQPVKESGMHGKMVKFDSRPEMTRSIALIDADPQLKGMYEKLNQAAQILALNEDTYTALDKLPLLLEKKNMGLRNMVTAIRFEHRMLPRIDQFLYYLRPLICDEADLIMSIGAGHTQDDYNGRASKVSEIFNTLNDLGMKPVIIRLHGKGDFENQRKCNSFGLPSITTYEIIYCRLFKSKIESCPTSSE